MNSECSVNVPSVSQYREVDFCGVKSGANVDKAARCGFTVFHGVPKNAPKIEECPVNLECTVVHTIELDSHCLVPGRIVEAHVSEDCLPPDGKLDFMRVDRIAFLDNPARMYCAIGQMKAEAFRDGLE